MKDKIKIEKEAYRTQDNKLRAFSIMKKHRLILLILDTDYYRA